MASIVNIIRISSSFDWWWKAEDMKKILWHVMPFTCLAACRPDSHTLKFEGSSSTLVLLFCHSWGVLVCSSHVELSHGTDGLQNMLVILAYALATAQESGLQGIWKVWHVTISSSYPQPFIIDQNWKIFYYIHNWNRSQMLMLLKKKIWISSSFPCWYCPWIIYYFISDLFSISFVNK